MMQISLISSTKKKVELVPRDLVYALVIITCMQDKFELACQPMQTCLC